MSFKYEIGDRFKTTYCLYEVKDRCADKNGRLYYWMVDEFGEPNTYDESSLNSWKKIEPFFKVGDTYKIGVQEGEILYVTERGDKISGLVLYTLDGQKWTESISAWTYQAARDIKHSKV